MLLDTSRFCAGNLKLVPAEQVHKKTFLEGNVSYTCKITIPNVAAFFNSKQNGGVMTHFFYYFLYANLSLMYAFEHDG